MTGFSRPSTWQTFCGWRDRNAMEGMVLMPALALFLRIAGIAIAGLSGPGGASAPDSGAADAAFVVTPVAEKTVRALPSQPLYWRVERFGTHAEAVRDALPQALLVDE